MLKSCANVTVAPGKPLKIIVVENGEAIYGRDLVAEFSADLDISYVNAPDVGLVKARNAGISAFLDSGADWYASLDDDGAVTAGWLTSYIDAISKMPEGRAFAGPTPQIEMATASKWYRGKRQQVRKAGDIEWNASTANVVLHRSILSSDGENMRFDTRYNLTGGEDTQFFRRLKHKKIPIYWIPDAIILEKVDESRGKFKNRFRRTVQFSRNRGQIAIDEHGKVGGVIANMTMSLMSFIKSVLVLPTGLILAAVKRDLGQIVFSEGIVMLAQSVGRAKAIIPRSSNYYQTTDGE